MRICAELIDALRYKLRLFGIPIDGPANVFCDNNLVVINATIPTSPAGIMRIAKVKTDENLADVFTKSLPGPKLQYLMSLILW